MAQLEALGFQWNPDEAGWDAMLAKLAGFHAEHGHCRVSQRHPADPKLGQWVSFQRQCKKRLATGDSNPKITAWRVAKLDALEFDWVLPA